MGFYFVHDSRYYTLAVLLGLVEYVKALYLQAPGIDKVLRLFDLASLFFFFGSKGLLKATFGDSSSN
jgi:hypothetical protein